MFASRGAAEGVSSARTVRLALFQVGVVSLVLAGVEAALFVHGSFSPVWVLLLFVAVAVLYVLAGLLAWVRRPSNRVGALLCVGGMSLLVAALENTEVPALEAAGLILGAAPIAVILHILLAFPSGRLTGPVARALVGAGYVVTIVFEAPRYLLAGAANPLRVAARPDLVQVCAVVQDSLGAVVLVLSAIVLASRLRASSRLQRRVLGALYGYGIVAILVLEAAVNVLPPLFGFGPITVFVLQISAAAGIPVAFCVGVLRGGFARTAELEELGAWLGAREGGRAELREALASALGDPSVQLLFWLPDAKRYVNARGEGVQLPRAGSGRGAVEVELGGARVGAIEYDALLIFQPALVRAAGRVIALALERERLTAQLLASRRALRESRARIVQATDRERRRLARDLHDGLQAQLVLLAIKAGRIAEDEAAGGVREQALELRWGLEAAGGELRRLVQGVMPALLIERGLGAATEDLVDRLPLPTRLELAGADGALPDGVQSTGYFVIAEALTNAVKHSRARELAVRVARTDDRLRIEVRDDGVGGARLGGGSGLRGIADRLDVLGGQLQVESAPGRGTLVAAEVPCGS